jgi:hypothetical protein
MLSELFEQAVAHDLRDGEFCFAPAMLVTAAIGSARVW